MKKKLAIIAAAVALASSWGSSAYALAITDSNVVGLVIDAVPFGDAARVTYTNTLLAQAAGANVVIGTERYVKTSHATGSTSVSLADSTLGTGVATISGWEYVLVKYDGPNAGAVLLYLGGASFTLEQYDQGIFNNALWPNPNTHAGGQACTPNCGISGWTAYNAVPDGGSTAVLLGSALLGVGMLRRRFSKN